MKKRTYRIIGGIIIKQQIEVRTLPIRENRIGSTIVYGGKASQMINETRKKCLKHADRTFNQGSACEEMLATCTLLTVRDTVSIFHSPVGCSTSTNGLNIFNRFGQLLRERPASNARWISTNLTEEDTVFGGEAKLKTAIIESDKRYSPEAIFILTSCVSGIIGDDIEAIANSVQPRVKASIVPIRCEGFRTKVWATAYDDAFYGVLKYLIHEAGPKQDDLVNIISPITIGRSDEIEIEKLLTKLGLKANIIPAFATVDQLKASAQAAASASICPTYSEYYAKTLKDKYGIPYIQDVMPIGISNTDRWLRQLGAIFGKGEQVEQVIAREHTTVLPKIEKLKNKLKGKRVYISGGQSRAAFIPSLLDELGLKLVGITTYHHDYQSQEGFGDAVKRFGDFTINVANMQPFEQANILNKEKVDIYLGNENAVWALKQGIPTSTIFNYLFLYIGYNGALAFGNKILKAISNPGFSRNLSANTSLPYRNSWYDQNAFAYIRGE
ncbi:MAG: nitrogen fixation protein NifE [Candidatus Methanoperedenaceae archaeon]|nr:MAG: nitrogen fixation protein NifE [Candidatus Methanoperedenaceae archaeon]